MRSFGDAFAGNVISNSKSGHSNRINSVPFSYNSVTFGRWVPRSVRSGLVASGISNGVFWVQIG
jgi:hypothetical protein